MELVTREFGTVNYEANQVIHLPDGLPAFEQEHEFLPIEDAATAPVVFLQSLRQPNLAFITLPVLLVDPGYSLAISPEDLETLNLPPDRQPGLGTDVHCLVIITVPDGGRATANLMAPIVINIKTKCAVQAIQAESGYSHEHPLPAPNKEAEC